MTPTLVLLSDQSPPAWLEVERRLRGQLAGRSGRVAYLPCEPDPERVWFAQVEARYARLGLELRYFGVEDEYELEELPDLLSSDALHLGGGNTFRFLEWLRARGLIEVLRGYAQGGGTLIGVSAGAILMTPDIGTAALCGDARYSPGRDDSGLGLVDFALMPHFDGSEAAQAGVRRFAKTFPGDVYGLPDGAAIFVRDGRVECLGPCLAIPRVLEQAR